MHGAGNDFIVVDNSESLWPENADFIRKICDRHRGIGADGLILLKRISVKKNKSFHMSFYNSDASPAEMCGNGLRCSALFCRLHFNAPKHIAIHTGAGRLDAWIIDKNNVRIIIPVTSPFKKVSVAGKKLFSGATGVPHVVKIVTNIDKIDVYKEGKRLRFHPFFGNAGTNVNFVSIPDKEDIPFRIRTYERGVENETSACGTGVAAAAICLLSFLGKKPPLKFLTKNSDIITVDLPARKNKLQNIKKVELTGPAVEVFQGKIKIGKDKK